MFHSACPSETDPSGNFVAFRNASVAALADLYLLLTVSGAKGLFRGIIMGEANMIVLFEDKKPRRAPAKPEATEPRSLFGGASARTARAMADVTAGLLPPDKAYNRDKPDPAPR